MRRTELVRRLSKVPAFPHPDPTGEQVATPADLAADLLTEALARGDVEGRTVVDLGAGTGVLALGAAILGAASVEAIERDPAAARLGAATSATWGLSVRWETRDVGEGQGLVDTVVMNPPFGAQRAHADRPFWTEAFRRGRRVYAYALADSRTFIERSAVARAVRIEDARPVPWTLPRTFPHHRKRSVELAVDRWILTTRDGP